MSLFQANVLEGLQCFHVTVLTGVTCQNIRWVKSMYFGTFGLPIHDFLCVCNSNIWPNSAPLSYTKLQNVSDHDFLVLSHNRTFVRNIEMKNEETFEIRRKRCGSVLFGPNDIRPAIFGCQATDSIPPQVSRKNH